MSENYEADVSEVVYAGPHCIEPGIYEIGVKVEPVPDASSEYIVLRFRPPEATFLAHLLQLNPPRVPAHEKLLAKSLVTIRSPAKKACRLRTAGPNINLRAPSKRRQCAIIGKEEIMPFDGTRYEGRIQALDKMDKVIDLLSDERRWCQKHLLTPDGRYCIVGAMGAAGGEVELKRPILLAIAQLTGRSYGRIEDFNDHRVTTHPLVVRVLWQARENIINDSPHPAEQKIGAWALFSQAFAKHPALA